MRARSSAWLAWGLFMLCVAGWAIQVATAAVTGDNLAVALLFVTAFLAAPAVGALIASRRPHNAVGWLLLAGGVALTLAGVGDDYVRHAAEAQSGWTRRDAAVAFVGLGFFSGLFYILGILVPLLFPDGRLLSRRWRSVVGVGACGLVLMTAGHALNPNTDALVDSGVESRNPLGIEAIAELADAVAGLGLLLLVLTAAAAWLSLVLRLRRSRGDERQQLKWFAFATGISAAALAVTAVAWASGAASLVFDALVSVALLTVLPAAIGIAILRNRLYDIDLLINRTLVYGALTLTTVGSYLVLVLGLGWLARTISGRGSNELAVAATTLIVAALFQPARRRIQSAVDRRFYRAHYDAEQTLEAFQARLRHEMDLETLQAELARAANQTMQPAHLSVWLRASGEQ